MTHGQTTFQEFCNFPINTELTYRTGEADASCNATILLIGPIVGARRQAKIIKINIQGAKSHLKPGDMISVDSNQVFGNPPPTAPVFKQGDEVTYRVGDGIYVKGRIEKVKDTFASIEIIQTNSLQTRYQPGQKLNANFSDLTK